MFVLEHARTEYGGERGIRIFTHYNYQKSNALIIIALMNNNLQIKRSNAFPILSQKISPNIDDSV